MHRVLHLQVRVGGVHGVCAGYADEWCVRMVDWMGGVRCDFFITPVRIFAEFSIALPSSSSDTVHPTDRKEPKNN